MKVEIIKVPYINGLPSWVRNELVGTKLPAKELPIGGVSVEIKDVVEAVSNKSYAAVKYFKNIQNKTSLNFGRDEVKAIP